MPEADDDALFRRIYHFVKLTDRLKLVSRSDYISGRSRKENAAEHTWHTMLLALLVHNEIDEPFDLDHVLKLLLVHDLPEVLVGDTPIFSGADPAKVHKAELGAIHELAAMLSDDAAGTTLSGLWSEYELGTSREAQVARFLDKFQGFTQNFASEGEGWREMRVTRERIFRVLDGLDGGPWLNRLKDWYAEEAERQGILPE